MAVTLALEKILPENVAKWITVIAKTHNACPEFLLSGILSSVSSMIGPGIKVRVSKTYAEPVNIYLVNVAYPGSGKSQAYGLTVRDFGNKRDLLDDYSRGGIVAHLETNPRAYLHYEEMGGFFDTFFKKQNEGSGERAFMC